MSTIASHSPLNISETVTDSSTVDYPSDSLAACFIMSCLEFRSVNFLPARRYASAGNSDRNVSICPSVRIVYPVLCQNEEC